ITFGVVVAKEIFGGTGRNFLNPALAIKFITQRMFLNIVCRDGEYGYV
ncbi:RnfABCDGE type electron transport complex subunit D, partial [Serratia marcescens]